jgi:AbrB family looped-hinge helix DNA binding protein
MSMTKITTKGQVTIPKRLRDHLGLKPGSSVEFELAADGRVFLRHDDGRRRADSLVCAAVSNR